MKQCAKQPLLVPSHKYFESLVCLVMLFCVCLGAIRGPALCTPLSWTLSSLLPVTHQYSTNVVESEKMEEPPGFYTRLWRWIHTNDDEMEVCVMLDGLCVSK